MNGKIRINKESLNSSVAITRHRVKDGVSIYRILPPRLDSDGYPYKKWVITWGLLDPQRQTVRPYVSGYMTGKFCPIDDYLKKVKVKIDNISKSISQLPEEKQEEAKNRLAKINAFLGKLRLRSVYVYNAIDKSGKVGLLEIPSTAHQQVKKIMAEYINDYGQDPTSLNSDPDDSGVWLKFTRTGTGLLTEYTVEKNQSVVKTNEGIMYKDDRSPLPEEVVLKYDSEMAVDLTKAYQIKSAEEIMNILLINLKNIIPHYPELSIDGYNDFSKITLENSANKESLNNETSNLENIDTDHPTAEMIYGKKDNNEIETDNELLDLANSILG